MSNWKDVYEKFFEERRVVDGDTVVMDRKPNLFSYEVMKRATELYEDTEVIGETLEEHYQWSWCVNTALAEHNYAID